jgi:hypothetical protein
MSYLKINVDDGNKEFVEQLLQKLGYEVTEEPQPKVASKKARSVSPTMLFGKWKNIDIDPANYRKQLWAPKK